ncbi:MAG: dUTP diphosphatase [Candidatus Thorarchaeota archaeon]
MTDPVVVKVKRLSEDAQIPKMAKPGDVAFDLYSTIDHELQPGERFAVPIGIAVEIPVGYEGQVRPRSGLALREGVTVLNSPGTIDSGYRGEVKCTLINHGESAFQITKGMRVGQLAIRPAPVVAMEEVDSLSDTERGEGGFGSTGK